MSKRANNQKLKLCVLSKIREHKSTLFGAFSDKLTKEDKVNCWKEVSVFAQSIGVLASNREWTYLRDVWWPNVKKLTTAKIDNARSTGTGGGKDKILTDVDNEVINIIGKDSPIIVGLKVPESMEAQEDSADAPSDTELDVVNQPSTSKQNCNVEVPAKKDEISNKRFKSNVAVKNVAKRYPEDRKKELQIILLEHQIYKTKLECKKLEMDIGYEAVLEVNNIEIINQQRCDLEEEEERAGPSGTNDGS